MVQKVFVSTDGMATFVCPECEKAVRVNVSKYGVLDHAVRIRAKCPCGHSYSVDLERRQHFRATVNLPGVVFRQVGSQEKDRMPMVVKDLSPRGVRFRVSQTGLFSPGDRCHVDFILDDATRSTIRKEILVTVTSGNEIGGEYTRVDSRDPSDQALGFYFIS